MDLLVNFGSIWFSGSSSARYCSFYCM